MFRKIIKLFLRLSLGIGFLSAVADRFGFIWTYHLAWGNWNAFVKYTHLLSPWAPASVIPFLAVLSTAAEIILGIFLIIGFKTSATAKLSGVLLLIFALSMTLNTGLKTALDASVYAASAGAFALSTMKENFLEIS